MPVKPQDLGRAAYLWRTHVATHRTIVSLHQLITHPDTLRISLRVEDVDTESLKHDFTTRDARLIELVLAAVQTYHHEQHETEDKVLTTMGVDTSGAVTL